MIGMNLDEFDLKLINILKENSRISISELSKMLNLSRQTVKSRLERLDKEGIIKKYTIKLSDELENRGTVFIIAETHVPERFEEVEEIVEVNRISDKRYILKLAVSDIGRIAEISNADWMETIEIIPVLETKEIERPFNIKITFRCDYCGKEMDDKPIVYRHHNRMYVLCCRTCLDEFKRI
jgi:DNA-binding Lrp family transcriptional regulator